MPEYARHESYVLTARLIASDCKNPDSKVENCPAVFVDDENGDLLIQGPVETAPATLTKAAEHSPLAENEMIVRLPASMREPILEKLGAEVVR